MVIIASTIRRFTWLGPFWALWLATVGAVWAQETFPDVQRFSGWVVGVDDGDSLSIRVGQSVRRVRLEGIDAPERHQPHAERARQRLWQLCGRAEATVEASGRDRYGRWLGQVRCRDGVWAQQAQLQAGLAWVYRAYVPDDSPLWPIEAAARAARRGLWADANPQAPWEWRRQHPRDPRP